MAVKLHFGEPGNLAYLRANYAKVVCDYVKRLGGKPFVTDCNTLYVGGRKNAIDHLDSAYANGYNPFATGVHTIIADGIKGTDERLVPVEGGEYVKEAKIGAAIMDADIVISLADEYNFDDVIARDDAVKVRLHMDSSMPQASIVSSNSVKNDDVFLLDSESPVGFALDIIDHIEYSLVSCDGFLWD